MLVLRTIGMPSNSSDIQAEATAEAAQLLFNLRGMLQFRNPLAVWRLMANAERRLNGELEAYFRPPVSLEPRRDPGDVGLATPATQVLPEVTFDPLADAAPTRGLPVRDARRGSWRPLRPRPARWPQDREDTPYPTRFRPWRPRAVDSRTVDDAGCESRPALRQRRRNCRLRQSTIHPVSLDYQACEAALELGLIEIERRESREPHRSYRRGALDGRATEARRNRCRRHRQRRPHGRCERFRWSCGRSGLQAPPRRERSA